MDQRVYSNSINVAQIAQALQSHFMAQGYQTQALGVPPNMLVQIKKKSTLRAVTGLERAMSIQFRDTPQGITVSLGEQKWADKAAVGAVGALIFAPLLVTAAYGAYRQAKMPEQIWQIIDSHTMTTGGSLTVPQPQTQPQYQAPPPYQGQPQQTPPQQPLPQQAPPQTQPPAKSSGSQKSIPKFCPDCGAPQQGSNFCPNCGRKHI